MRSIKKAVIYGLGVWAVPFAVAMLIFPLRENNRPLFESILPIAVVIGTLFFLFEYFNSIDSNYKSEVLILGLIWLEINLIIDLLMFMCGPMKMSFLEYMSDIGVTYLIIPSITFSMGFILEKKLKI